MRFVLLIFFTKYALMRKALGDRVIPEHYDLFINTESTGFNGNVLMHLRADESVKDFQFNSKDLLLSDLKVTQTKDSENLALKFEENEEFVTVHLKESIVGPFLLSVSFKGEYTQTMTGYYKSEYKNSFIYSTHFEPSDARAAFPCFDQPNMKSTFSITLQVPENSIGLSNTQVLKQDNGIYTFDKTEIMSTYIVAWVVGEMDYIEDRSLIPIRVYAHKDDVQWGKFGLDVAVKCLEFFEKYFKIKYPLPKLDMVSIPSFAMGAMENWGLVTFRKTSLLFDEKSTPMNSKKNIAVTVCHELAHMWFGNLVTMEWWDDLWLNEGFATWAATLAIDNYLQDILRWDAWSGFINDEIESGMKRDSLKSTHKIEVSVNDPVEIDQIFDAISYSKGSSIIKMLENWLGPETFRNGLIQYIKKYKYSNAVTLNLWESLDMSLVQKLKIDDGSNSTQQIAASNSHLKVSAFTEDSNVSLSVGSISSNIEISVSNREAHDSVQSVIDPWVKREGFPFITVHDDGEHLILTQSRFTLGFDKDDAPWPIPIKLKWENEDVVFVLREKVAKIKKNSKFYKLNDGVSGFYRVLYPAEHLKFLLTENYSKLSHNNILNLFSDQFAMIFSLKANLKSILELLDTLKNEENYEILINVSSKLMYLRSVFYFDQQMVNMFNDILTKVISGRASKIDLSTGLRISSSHDINEISMNSLLIALSVKIGDQNIISKLKSFDSSALYPEFLRSSFIASVDSNFNQLKDLYKNSDKPGEKQSALFALGATTIKGNIQYIFDNINEFESHETIYIFSSLGANISQRDYIVSLFIDNFEKIRKHINNDGLLRHAIEFIMDNSYTNNVNEFLNSISDSKELKSAVDQCFDNLNIAKKIKDHYSGFKLE